MSVKRLSLSSKPLIAVVVILVAVVIVFNVRTFGGARGSRHAAQVRMQASPPFPMDLEDVVRSSGQPAVAAADASAHRESLARDPFAREASVRKQAVATAGRNRPQHRRKSAPLQCDAVFPGGKAPLVLIKGKAYHIGDKVVGYTVGSIAPNGVKLTNRSGKELFLAVGSESEEQGTSRVITGLPAGDQGGRTRLVEYKNSERKIP